MHAYGLRDTVVVPSLGLNSFREEKYELVQQELEASRLLLVPDPAQKPATRFSERMSLPKEFYVPAKPSLYSRVSGALQSWTGKLSSLAKRRRLTTSNVHNTIAVMGDRELEGQPCLNAFAYHPCLDVWAVALVKDQSIRFFSRTTQTWLQLTLQHEFQHGVQDIQWNPVGGNSLAVASATGVCLWHFPQGFPSSSSSSSAASSERSRGTSSRPHRNSNLSAWMTHLARDGHTDVQTVEFSPCGRYLISSNGSWTLVVWDVAKPFGNATPLTTLGTTAGVVRWSARGDKVMISSVGQNEFRVWNARDWTDTKWSTIAPVVDACWNDAGNELLIATQGSSKIYTISLNRSVRGLQTSVILDTTLNAPEQADLKGASVRSMQWDSRSRRLAVAYVKANGLFSDLLALFDTEYRDKVLLQFTFIGFIRGPSSVRSDSSDFKSSVKKVAFKDELASPAQHDVPASISPNITLDSSATKRKLSSDSQSADSSLDFSGRLNVTPVPKKSSLDDSDFFSPQSKFIASPEIKSSSASSETRNGFLSPEFLATPKPKSASPSKKRKHVPDSSSSSALHKRSQGTNFPLCFSFKPGVAFGAFLVVCWAERHITTVPMIFEDSQTNLNNNYASKTNFEADVTGQQNGRRGALRSTNLPSQQKPEISAFVHPRAYSVLRT